MLFILLLIASIVSLNAETRIIGGQEALPGQFPYYVSLNRRGKHFCGGSLISNAVVVTAAHCVIGQIPTELTVLAGTINLNTKSLRSSSEAQSAVKSIKMHPQYNPKTQDYDIALISLSSPFKLGGNIDAIELANEYANYPADTLATIVGYGAVGGNLQLSSTLKYAEVQLWSRDYCNPQNVPGVTDRMICAGHPSGKVNACQGDSGGPLTVEDKLFGLVSWGFGCGAKNKPAMYTYVSSFRTWIKQNTGI